MAPCHQIASLHHAVSLDDEHGASAMRGTSGMGRIHADFTLTSADGWGAFIRLPNRNTILTFANEKWDGVVMQEGLLQSLEELGGLMAQLADRQLESRRREERLNDRITSLEQELAQLRAEAQTAQAEGAKQQAALAFGPNSEDSRQARRVIAQIVREIDQCIALLRS